MAALPPQAVSECCGARRVALPVHHTALTTWAQGPEGGGGARQIQADVPEGVYGGGDSTAGKTETVMRTEGHCSFGASFEAASVLSLGAHQHFPFVPRMPEGGCSSRST